MTALSSADKLKLRLSDARVERWNRERRKPAANDKPRCQGVIFAPGHDKVDETILPDRMEIIHRASDGFKVRTMAGKLSKHGNAIAARVHTIEHIVPHTGESHTQIVYDCPQNDPVPQDPAWKTNAPKHAKARPNSPFKRAGASLSSVVVIRK